MYAFKSDDKTEMYSRVRYNVFGMQSAKTKNNDESWIRHEQSVQNHHAHFLDHLMHMNRVFKCKLHEEEGIVSLQSVQELRDLLCHPKNQSIRLVNNSGFMVTLPAKKNQPEHSKYFSGLTKVMKRFIYPEIEEDPLKQTYQESKRRKVSEPYNAANKTTCKYVGKEHGKKVHEQIYQYLLLINVKESEQTGEYRMILNQLKKDIDPCTIRVISTCLKHGLLPLTSELMIWDEATDVATAGDIVCLNMESKKGVLVETKVGFENQEYAEHPTDKKFEFKGLTDVTNCPRSRHFLQVTEMMAIFRKVYGYTFEEAVIIRTCPKQKKTLFIPLDAWCFDPWTQNQVYNILKMNKED